MSGVEVHYLGRGTALDPVHRDSIRADLVAAMPRHEVNEYLTAKPHILSACGHIAVAESAGRCVGLMAASDHEADGMPFAHIETLLVGERLHGHGTASLLVRALFTGIVQADGDFPDTVAMKTYAPKAYVMMRRFDLGREIVFTPRIDAPGDVVSTLRASRLARHLSPECPFRRETAVLRGGGGQISADFWHDRPLSEDPAVDAFFHREVGVRDRVLCVVHAPTRTAKDTILEALEIARPSPTDSLTRVPTQCRKSTPLGIVTGGSYV